MHGTTSTAVAGAGRPRVVRSLVRQERRSAFGIGMQSLIAWRNLSHERVRLVITLVGVAFSVALIAIQLGLLVGFAETASSIVDLAGADVWIAARGTRNVDEAVEISERALYRASSTPGVAAADPYIVHFAAWKRPDGGSESVNLVGFDLERGVGAPWNLVEGSVQDLKQPDAVIVDVVYKERLGISRVGETVEINRHRARIVGFTQGIRAFTQSPYVFTSLQNARAFSGYPGDELTYVLVRTTAGANPSAVRTTLAGRLPVYDVWSADGFSAQTRYYWLFTTGAGIALVIGALLGLIVGAVIVGQTLYANTIERLPEYGMLRAMGASGRYLHAIVVRQAAISAVFGSAIGLLITLALVHAARLSTVALVLPLPLAIGVAAVTVMMCVGAALVSIRKLTRLDPAELFQ